MHIHEYPNLDEYLTSFLKALNHEAANEGTAAFKVQVLESGLETDEVEKLR